MISFCNANMEQEAFVEQMFTSFYKNISNKFSYEFLIIDNGSDDGTVELLKEYSSKDNSLRVWYNQKNKNLNEYKKLFARSNEDFVIIIDDDVIEFPPQFDKVMVDYITVFSDFGFISLDVIQNEFTEGAKPSIDHYTDVHRSNKTISEGPAGGWCAIFRRRDYRKIKLLLN